MGKYEDLIKRLRHVAQLADKGLVIMPSVCLEAANAIEKLSAINDQKMIGEWFGEADGYADGELVYDTWSCGCCGKYFPEWDEKPGWNYCPNCGADMRGEKDV